MNECMLRLARGKGEREGQALTVHLGHEGLRAAERGAEDEGGLHLSEGVKGSATAVWCWCVVCGAAGVRGPVGRSIKAAAVQEASRGEAAAERGGSTAPQEPWIHIQPGQPRTPPSNPGRSQGVWRPRGEPIACCGAVEGRGEEKGGKRAGAGEGEPPYRK